MGQDFVGMRGGDGFFNGYNPFDLYGAAERARGKPLSPHLVFAELDQSDPNDACAFLNAYGPLEATTDIRNLKEDERAKWKNMAAKSPVPEEHFRSTLGEVPLLPSAPTLQDDDYYCCSRSLFWGYQSEFEMALRLHSALESPTDQIGKIRRTLSAKGTQWNIRGQNIERQYINRARQVVMTTVNKHLQLMSPRLARSPGGSTVTAVWGCYTLLQAMYLMLFLDIAGWSGRIVQCEKCHSVFYTGLDRVKYCSPVCENRARALRAYHKKGSS
jgi:hypothetical protein